MVEGGRGGGGGVGLVWGAVVAYFRGVRGRDVGNWGQKIAKKSHETFKSAQKKVFLYPSASAPLNLVSYIFRENYDDPDSWHRSLITGPSFCLTPNCL